MQHLDETAVKDNISVKIMIGEDVVGKKVFFHDIPTLADIAETKEFVERILVYEKEKRCNT